MKKAFTLAEVLITLGIIGVISAMTIPTLIHKYKNDEYIAGMKKSYSVLAQATAQALHDLGLEKFASGTTDGTTAIRNAMKCVASGGPGVQTGFTNATSCILPDGQAITLGYKSSNNTVIYGAAFVDTNGTGTNKRPNLYGKDRWAFLITVDGRVIPAGNTISNDEGQAYTYGDTLVNVNNNYTVCTNNNAGTFATAGGCAGRLVRDNWHINY